MHMVPLLLDRESPGLAAQHTKLKYLKLNMLKPISAQPIMKLGAVVLSFSSHDQHCALLLQMWHVTWLACWTHA